MTTDTEELNQLANDFIAAIEAVEGDDDVKAKAKAKVSEALALALEAAEDEDD